MFDTPNRFYAFSPWIALFFGALTLALHSLSQAVYASLQVFVLVSMLGIGSQLLTLAVLPFALVRLWRAGKQKLRKDDVTQAFKRIDWSVVARSGRHIAAVIGPHSRTLLGQLTSALRILARAVSKQSHRVNWYALRRKALWILATLAVTALPFVIMFGVLVVLANSPATKRDFVQLMPLVTTIGTPFLFIATVALKTKFDMPRVFSYSPRFLKRVRNTILISGPVGAVIVLFAAASSMATSDLGWLIFLVPLYGGIIIGSACALAFAVWIVEMIAPNVTQSRPLQERTEPPSLGTPV